MDTLGRPPYNAVVISIFRVWEVAACSGVRLNVIVVGVLAPRNCGNSLAGPHGEVRWSTARVPSIGRMHLGDIGSIFNSKDVPF